MEALPEPDEKEPEFTFHSKSFFCTYPNVDGHDVESIRDGLKEKHPDIKELWVAEELHADGKTKHYHVCGKFQAKKKLRGADCFDIWGEWGLHPNIQSAKNWKKVKKYVCKDGKFLAEGNHELDYSTASNFVRRKSDYNAWRSHLSANLKRPFPGKLVFGDFTLEWNITAKKRHHWFVGPSDAGKSTTVGMALEYYRVLKVAKGNYPYEAYNNHDFVWWDSCMPENQECVDSISEYEYVERAFYGNHRYHAAQHPVRKHILMIVTHNKLPDYVKEMWFWNRFQVWEFKSFDSVPVLCETLRDLDTLWYRYNVDVAEFAPLE